MSNDNLKGPDMPLSEDGNDVWASMRSTLRGPQNAKGTAELFARTALDAAFESLSKQDRDEIQRRMTKLFIQQFRSPEVSDTMLAVARERAKEVAKQTVEAWSDKIEAHMRDWMEKTYPSLVEGFARSVMADLLLGIGKVLMERFQKQADVIEKGTKS